MAETTMHPEFRAVARRLANLMLSKRLNQKELEYVCSAFLDLAEIWLAFCDEFGALVNKDLPDPGCRPDVREAVAFLEDRSKPRSFDLALGYVHRVREYVERLEATYGIEGGAA
jgi:hypothetical protein